MKAASMKVAFAFSIVGAAMISWACGADPRGDVLGDASPPDGGDASDAAIATDGAIEKPPFDPEDEAITCATSPCAVELVAGEHHFCARMNDGTARCWGDDTKGALGADSAGDAGDSGDAGDAGDWSVPRVSRLTDLTRISAAGATTCALGADGGVACWGANDEGQLGAGVGDDARHPAPAPVALAGSARRVDVGPSSACAVLSSGETWCWGANSWKQLARETPTHVGVPAKAELGAMDIARTAAGTYTGFAVTTSGELASWGAVSGPEGSVSARAASLSPDPRPVSLGLGPVTSFSVSSTTMYLPPYPETLRGIGHACAVVKGEVLCWGDSRMGALGAGVPELVKTPVRAALTNARAWAQQVSAGGDVTCVRLTDGTVECAGDNAFGALGRSEAGSQAVVFRPVESLDGHVVQVAASSRTICALVQGGGVVCWGSNERSELGQGRSDGDPHPTPASVVF